MTEFSLKCIDLMKNIPEGKVATYGQIAVMAGNPGGARQVARLLHSSSKRHNIPWHRIVGAGGVIRLPEPYGGIQKQLLEDENVVFLKNGHINMKQCTYRNS